jgi:hypothetical protein
MPVMLHLSCDKFQGELLERDRGCDDDEVTYSTTRMLPPGEITYYYTVNGQPQISESDPNQDSFLSTANGYRLYKLGIPRTNLLANVTQTRALLTKTYLTNLSCIPRPEPKNLKGREKLKTPWDFNKSVFKDYKPDNVQLLEQCFEFDWECSKIPRVIKGDEEVDRCKEYLKTVYKHM